MAVSAITGSSTASALATAAAGTGNSALGQDAFFKLLMAQMKNQNPLEPVNATDFVGQLSQFSTVQGIQQMNANFSNLLALQGMSQGAALIGKSISYDAGNGALAKGKVDSVAIDATGKMQLMVGKIAVPLSHVRGINATTN